MGKIELEYIIPMQSEERVSKSNEEFGTDFKSTEWHFDDLVDKLTDMVTEAILNGGGYVGDHVSVKIEVKYNLEDK